MPVREIKTTIALDGEKEFKRAMADAQREMRLMGAELKQVASEFDLAGDQQDYYTRRSGILRNQIQQQKNIVAAYEKAVGDMAKKHGEASKEVQDMSISLTTAQTKLNKLQKELDDNEKAAKDFGKAVEKNVEKEAKDAGKAVDSLGDELSGLDGKLGGIEGALDGLRNLTGIDLGMDLFGQVPDWVNQVLEWGSEGRGYAKTQSEIKYAAQWAGIDEATVQSEINRVAALTQDREGAQSGITMLLNVPGMTPQILSAVLDNLLGADIRFSELGFGQLAEGFQESASSGQLAGPFLELLERSGYQQTEIDEINAALAQERTGEGRSNVLLTALQGKRNAQGQSNVDIYRMYAEENRGIIEAEGVSQQKQQAWDSLKASDALQGFTASVDMASIGFATLIGDIADSSAKAERNYWLEAQPGANYWATHTPQNWYEEMLAGGNQPLPEGYSAAAVPEKPGLGFVWGRMWGSVTEWGEPIKDYEARMANQNSGGFVGPPLPPETQSMLTDPALLSEETGRNLQEAAQNIATAYSDVMQQLGIDLGSDLGAGITEGGKGAIQAMQDVVDGINTAAAGIVVPQVSFPMSASTGGGYAGGGMGGNVYLDGRRVGQIMTPTINGMMGRQS